MISLGSPHVLRARMGRTCGEPKETEVTAAHRLFYRSMQAGRRMLQEDILDCSDAMFDLLCSCWDADPFKRPRFAHLVEQLSPTGPGSAALYAGKKKSNISRVGAFPMIS